MNWIPVSSQSLRRRDVDLDSCVYRNASVLPFFTSDGEVPLCLLVLPQTSRLYFFTPREVGPRVPLWGTIRFQNSEWSSSNGTGGPKLDGLQHFDPDWLLRDERFADMEVVPLLRKTNCCTRLPPDVRYLYYRRDLSCVQYAYRVANDQIRLVAATKVLPSCPPNWSLPADSTTPRSRGGSWRLNPIWMRSR
jgi:hypothetical protein